MPDWLTWFVPDTIQEELEIDEETLIRSIMFDHVNKTLERNSKIAGIGSLESDSDGYNK